MNTASTTRLPTYAVLSPDDVLRFAAITLMGAYDLGPAEEEWRDRQPFLESHGYMLRPRYHADWSPSWTGTNRDPTFCEDSILLNKHNVIDAIRLSDGLGVSVKTTPNDSQEIAIATFVSSLNLLDDPSNHCVKLLEVLPDPLHADRSLMIMPYLRPFDDPEFGAIGEVVDFVKQTLEGICFLHKHRIAHRDCAAANIMMDGRPLYPNGHHPIRRDHSVDAMYELSPLPRIDHPVRYHLIDFGISTRFPVGSSTYVTGLKGRDKDVPELSADVPYDAMKVDIFTLGNLYHKEFVQKYHGLDFLQPLIGAMTQRQPERRPAAEVALAIFEDISSRLNSSLLRWRLRSRAESQPERVLYDTVAVAREGIYHLKRLVT